MVLGLQATKSDKYTYAYYASVQLSGGVAQGRARLEERRAVQRKNTGGQAAYY
jgi:hypothetical protein